MACLNSVSSIRCFIRTGLQQVEGLRISLKEVTLGAQLKGSKL